MKATFLLAITFAGLSEQRLLAQTMVDWAVPALPSNKPQTDEAAKYGQEHGRQLPEPEILQPVLDSALTSYQPRHDRALSPSRSSAIPSIASSVSCKYFGGYNHLDAKIAQRK